MQDTACLDRPASAMFSGGRRLLVGWEPSFRESPHGHGRVSLTLDPRQVLENMRRQSADGLALPFLLNWALGMCRVCAVVVHRNINYVS